MLGRYALAEFDSGADLLRIVVAEARTTWSKWSIPRSPADAHEWCSARLLENMIDASFAMGDHEMTTTKGAGMTSMWKRGSQCQHHGTAIAAMRPSGHRSIFSRPALTLLTSAGSSP